MFPSLPSHGQKHKMYLCGFGHRTLVLEREDGFTVHTAGLGLSSSTFYPQGICKSSIWKPRLAVLITSPLSACPPPSAPVHSYVPFAFSDLTVVIIANA